MTASNVPEEEVKKRYLKIRCDGGWRKIVWTGGSFEDLQKKVKDIFHHRKSKLFFRYRDNDYTLVIMGSNEEFNTALELLQGDTLILFVDVHPKQAKKVVMRYYRKAKAAGSRAIDKLADIRPALEDLVPKTRRFIVCYRKYILALLFLALALFVVYERINRPPPLQVEILAAYSGLSDVTAKVQEFYDQTGMVLAHHRAFGLYMAPFYNQLHVVYRVYTSDGRVNETFSQSFHESTQPQALSMSPEPCPFHAIHKLQGKTIEILGALFGDVQATCAAKIIASTGIYLEYAGPWPDGRSGPTIHRQYFQSQEAGLFTLVYLKDGVQKVFQGLEGDVVHF